MSLSVTFSHWHVIDCHISHIDMSLTVAFAHWHVIESHFSHRHVIECHISHIDMSLSVTFSHWHVIECHISHIDMSLSITWSCIASGLLTVKMFVKCVIVLRSLHDHFRCPTCTHITSVTTYSHHMAECLVWYFIHLGIESHEYHSWFCNMTPKWCLMYCSSTRCCLTKANFFLTYYYAAVWH